MHHCTNPRLSYRVVKISSLVAVRQVDFKPCILVMRASGRLPVTYRQLICKQTNWFIQPPCVRRKLTMQWRKRNQTSNNTAITNNTHVYVSYFCSCTLVRNCHQLCTFMHIFNILGSCMEVITSFDVDTTLILATNMWNWPWWHSGSRPTGTNCLRYESEH